MANDVIDYKKFDIVGIGTRGSMDHIIDSIPILNIEQERGFLVDYRVNGNIDSAKKLVVHNLRYVRSVAMKYIGYGFQLHELMHEGVIGLMVALNRYDMSFNVPLIGYAASEIANTIKIYVMRYANTVSIPDGIGENGKHINKTLFYRLKPTISMAQMREGTLNITPTVIEAVSEELGVSVDAINTFLVRSQSEVRYDDQDDDHVYSWEPITETLEDEVICSEFEEEYNQVLCLVDELDDRSKDILLSRYTGEQVTLAILSDRYGISKERVRQIEVKALNTIKTKMESQNV